MRLYVGRSGTLMDGGEICEIFCALLYYCIKNDRVVEQRKTKEGTSQVVKYDAIHLSPEAELGQDIAYQAWYW